MRKHFCYSIFESMVLSTTNMIPGSGWLCGSARCAMVWPVDVQRSAQSMIRSSLSI